MADPARARKLAKRISQIVAHAIEHDIKDPRLNHVTITDTKITADLHDATVYYTVLGENLESTPDHAGAAAALESARGVLRTKVGQGTGVRYTPTLAFVADSIPEDAKRIEDLLAKAREADAEVARRATGAQHAGEADPYKPPREEAEDDEFADEETRG
ncbi:30S ribosome-binding factor RbfA [Amycolatopsis umgeniensis]|uniref:Ribosome-binding factor A n=1 Tax=Amycolatopsis umgeniensis TaxID=336628 RepID=A0A841BCH5_9PSEU|nr:MULTISPECIES: 30S ribosome-binding factor RbfA [Amycolatopsis]AUI57405.1 ribosome-binding factor A [Amycolatopsis sp. BJA-103]MBB5856535.1 ribosome-binding factor A [Amycolatopsis umgeniensis]PNE14020.1 ribosome-binding factor A [Amycolatopsis sp. BJA-103]